MIYVDGRFGWPLSGGICRKKYPSENSCFQTDISLYPLQSTSNPTQINEKERASPQTPAISRILGIVILR